MRSSCTDVRADCHLHRLPFFKPTMPMRAPLPPLPLSSPLRFLAIDVGNTRLKWALYDAPHPNANILAHGAVFLENIDTLAEQTWQHLATPNCILGCMVAGEDVKMRVMAQLDIWHTDVQWVVANESEAGLHNGYEHPHRLGADRWVAMLGARHHQNNQVPLPLVVVMVGTAVTVDAIDSNGHFLGGFIVPGHGIMLRALETGTAGLHVPTGNVVPFPTNTSDALTSGGTFAIAGAISRMVHHVEAHCKTKPQVLMTGGAGWKMAPSMDVPFELVDHLIFEGLLALAMHRFV